MEKGIWEQAFLNSSLRERSSDSSPGLRSDDWINDDLLSPVDRPFDPREYAVPQGKWESEFSNKGVNAAEYQAASAAPQSPMGTGPAEPTAPESRPSPNERTLPPRRLEAVPVYREKSKSGPPLLASLGDFLDRIWVSLLLKSADQHPKTFLLCGATRGVGVTFISFYLSLALALERNMSVLYVDANIDSPQYPSIIPNLQGQPGLSSYLAGYRSPETLILQSQYKNLSVLPSGSHEVMNPVNSVHQKPRTIAEFVNYCSAHFDATIFDGQPAIEYPSTSAIAKAVDRTILICRYGVSRREISRLVIDKLKESGVAVAGVILNERQYPIPVSVYKMLK
jgi:Mrp family chromosome partitioning ATPase